MGTGGRQGVENNMTVFLLVYLLNGSGREAVLLIDGCEGKYGRGKKGKREGQARRTWFLAKQVEGLVLERSENKR